MNYTVTTQPSIEPVKLAEAKLHLRIDHDTDDALITSLIKVAREWCESYQNRAYITQTITWKLDDFPRVFIVPKPKLQSVTTIKYIDVNGEEQTLSSSEYDVDVYSQPARIVEAFNSSWPGIRGDINSVEVIYVAGYGDAATDVPESVIAAMKLLVGHLYENRELSTTDSLKEIPFGVKSLLNFDRVQVI